MSGCPLSYFTRATWVVMDPPPPNGETKGHILRIKDLGNNSVEIACGDRDPHDPYPGQYNPATGRIEGPDCFIEGLPELGQIKWLSLLAPDGWTANDSGALSGGG